MDFFRHNYDTSTDYLNRWTSDFDNMGFVQYDGTSLLDLADPSARPPMMKWKYESLTNPNETTGYGQVFFSNHSAGGNAYLQFYQVYGRTVNYDWSKEDSSSSVVFFIPLKNKGFLYRLQTKNTLTTVQPFRKFLYPKEITGNTKGGSRDWVEFIGFQSNVSSISPYSYITLGHTIGYQQKNSDTGTNNRQYYEDLQEFPTQNYSSYDYYHRIWIDGVTRYLNFIDGANMYSPKEGPTNQGEWKPLLTVDVNQNVCTLMHVPYDNTYLDNIYLLVTAPQEDMDSKFFSFGGRNFLNLGTNIVVELPAN